MKDKKRLRILSFIVIGYMLMALLWWAVLLNRKNHEAFTLQTELLQEKAKSDSGISIVDVSVTPEFQKYKKRYERQMYMIYGEALVFALTLIMGIYFINRAYVRELASSEKQKNFLLSITHELKSPLASINLILSTFIKRDLPQDKIKELSHDGIKESSRLEELFNKILISTRLGKAYTYNFEPNNLSSLIQNTVDDFAKIHDEALFETKIDADIIKDIDREAMVSVVNNLLENALKYSPNEKHISVSLVKSEEKVTFIVADKGIGISKQERLQVFDQFYRVGSEDTRMTKGTGLGLYIVNQIITGHKGKIRIDNNEGGGTKFIITL